MRAEILAAITEAQRVDKGHDWTATRERLPESRQAWYATMDAGDPDPSTDEWVFFPHRGTTGEWGWDSGATVLYYREIGPLPEEKEAKLAETPEERAKRADYCWIEDDTEECHESPASVLRDNPGDVIGLVLGVRVPDVWGFAVLDQQGDSFLQWFNTCAEAETALAKIKAEAEEEPCRD